MISLAQSTITPKVRENVSACLDENRIGSGRFVPEFEQRVAEYCKAKYGIAVCNGTMADIVALAALKAKRPDKDEVIVPALTFVAQVNSILVNGLKPVFVDVNYDYQIDVSKIKINDKTLAIMPANLLGKSCDITRILEIARLNDIYVLEDSCEAFGIPPRGDLATYSFFPSHTVTTGEGGMIVTNNKELAELCIQARNHGRKSEEVLDKFHFDNFGLNGKMSNLNAAVGCGIIDSADEVIIHRVANVNTLNRLLEGSWDAFSPHAYPIMYESEVERNQALLRLSEAEIEARKLFSSLPTQEKCFEYMGYKLGDFPTAEDIGRRGLFVPIHQGLSEGDLLEIVKCV